MTVTVAILGDGSQIRHYTYGGDLAKGIVTCMSAEAARNELASAKHP